MIYQQEVKEVNDFYERYKDKQIVFSKEVTLATGLVQRDTAVKLGETVLSAALISSTMESLVVMARLDEIQKQQIYDQNGSLSVQLKFISSETGKPILLTIYTKLLNLNTQGLSRKDLYFLAMQTRRKIPNDLIRIFGLYHRDSEDRLRNKKKKVECLLLSSEVKADCLTESISKTELVLNVDDSGSVILNQKAIAILKVINTGEVVEIIGTIAKKDIEPSGSCRLSLKYSMEDQSPRFGYSIHVLKNLINI